ncbi:MAG: DUF5615 family PIN-like protein [Anaerolineae bacterium]|nr:DUF5615 family PIN-like protein [Anaerolineae bacterium]
MAEKIKFYTDTHIAKAVAVQLRQKGVDIVRCEEVGMAEASDLAHLEYATQHNRIVISHDSDFLALHAEWQEQEHQHAGIIRVASHLQDKRHIGTIVKEVLAYHQLVEIGAASDDDFRNHVYFIG